METEHPCGYCSDPNFIVQCMTCGVEACRYHMKVCAVCFTYRCADCSQRCDKCGVAVCGTSPTICRVMCNWCGSTLCAHCRKAFGAICRCSDDEPETNYESDIDANRHQVEQMSSASMQVVMWCKGPMQPPLLPPVAIDPVDELTFAQLSIGQTGETTTESNDDISLD